MALYDIISPSMDTTTQQDSMTSSLHDQNGIGEGLNSIGIFAIIVGALNIVAAFVLGCNFFSGSDVGFLTREYHNVDIVMNFFEGVLYILLGVRIKGRIHRTRLYLYLWIFSGVTLLTTLLSLSVGIRPVLTMILLFFSGRALFKLHSKISEGIHYRLVLQETYVVLLLIAMIVTMIIALVADTKKSQESTVANLVILLPADKSSESSKVSGNVYQNTKYRFKITFPTGWIVGPGEKDYIVEKATHENSTISVVIKQFEMKGFDGSFSVKDLGPLSRFVSATIKAARNSSSDIKTINEGETTINGEPAYWVEYSGNLHQGESVSSMTSLVYSFAKGNIVYYITSRTNSSEYAKMKPLFMKTVSTVTFE
jgi:hypothetical protein